MLVIREDEVSSSHCCDVFLTGNQIQVSLEAEDSERRLPAAPHVPATCTCVRLWENQMTRFPVPFLASLDFSEARNPPGEVEIHSRNSSSFSLLFAAVLS